MVEHMAHVLSLLHHWAAMVWMTPDTVGIAPVATRAIFDALAHDLDTATTVWRRQWAMPFTAPFGFPVLIAAGVFALALAWPARVWLLGRQFVLLQRAPVDHRLAVAAKAVGTVVVSDRKSVV